MGNRLSNGILSVDIADVEAYKGTRFDWTGFITQVTLEQGKHTFCVPESLIPSEGSGGQGLCNEFGISRAIGYDEITAGEWFPKPGVGLLQKQNLQPYSFTEDYTMQPFSIDIEVETHAITYTVHPMESNGYAMQLTKTISVSEDKLKIGYELQNKGSKPFQTEEYVHNFIGIDNIKAGKEYELRLPGNIKVTETESDYTAGLLQISENRLSWKEEPDKPFYCMLGGWKQSCSDYNWELIHKPSGTGVRESGDFPITRMALWGERHVISPEVFVNISVLPRESKKWSRTYQFFTTT